MKKIIRIVKHKFFHRYAIPTESQLRNFKLEFIPILFFKSLFSSIHKKDNLKDITTFCYFIGYPRSGHSLVGSLLDAHPNAVISHEADFLKLVQNKIFSQNQILSFLIDRSEEFGNVGLNWTGYDYVVPNQWQGRYTNLKIVGDKKGGSTTGRFSNNKWLLEYLEEKITLNKKVIHHVRNPYDNISTMQLRDSVKDKKISKNFMDKYFHLCSTNRYLKEKIDKDNFFEQKHEFLVSNPGEYIKQLCDFLNIECTDDYLKDCESIIFESPNKSRNKLQWSDKDIEYVQSRIEEFDFLKGYRFDD